MRSAQQYIATAKEKLGDPKMSDRELGERLGGFSQTFLSQAKRGKMTDPLAMRIAAACDVPAGEVLMVARLEREKDPAVRAALEEWAGKISGLLDQERAVPDARVLAGPNVPELAIVDVAMPRATKRSAPLISQRGASIGGEGGIRTHGTLFTYA